MKEADIYRGEHLNQNLIPRPQGDMIYKCLGCGIEIGIGKLFYTCPSCGSVFMLEDLAFDRLKDTPPEKWRARFDYRRLLNIQALNGIYRFHELLGPMISLKDVVYLGEGNTPLIPANQALAQRVGMPFFFKHDGLNPSLSFKDRGMASAFSYLNTLISWGKLTSALAICASTGDTSASAALYGAYVGSGIKTAVILPKGKVTPEQLGQPLGSGAMVIDVPGVFDDCMKVVEYMAENYPVMLLNSKNPWRILGQESYAYEIAQDLDWEVGDVAVFVPIGNAGNITAILSGFLKLFRLGIIDQLPKIVGVQSEHADPVYRYYLEPDDEKRVFEPVTVKPSVAQAAMIGNPVSMPRVITLVRRYNAAAGFKRVFVVEASEQQIMDNSMIANRNGLPICTQGGECLAGLITAHSTGVVSFEETVILDSTAHGIKFAGFQHLYFDGSFPPEFKITPRDDLKNRPIDISSPVIQVPSSDSDNPAAAYRTFVVQAGGRIAELLGL